METVSFMEQMRLYVITTGGVISREYTEESPLLIPFGTYKIRFAGFEGFLLHAPEVLTASRKPILIGKDLMYVARYSKAFAILEGKPKRGARFNIRCLTPVDDMTLEHFNVLCSAERSFRERRWKTMLQERVSSIPNRQPKASVRAGLRSPEI
jgi:hypothetical protein